MPPSTHTHIVSAGDWGRCDFSLARHVCATGFLLCRLPPFHVHAPPPRSALPPHLARSSCAKRGGCPWPAMTRPRDRRGKSKGGSGQQDAAEASRQAAGGLGEPAAAAAAAPEPAPVDVASLERARVEVAEQLRGVARQVRRCVRRTCGGRLGVGAPGGRADASRARPLAAPADLLARRSTTWRPSTWRLPTPWATRYGGTRGFWAGTRSSRPRCRRSGCSAGARSRGSCTRARHDDGKQQQRWGRRC